MPAAPFHWIAYYNDGTMLRDVDPDTGRDNSGEHIDRARLKHFVLLDANNKPLVIQHLDAGQRFIYRRRVEKFTNGAPDIVCHLIGWQQTVAGQSVQHICYVFETGPNAGQVHNASRFRDDHPWFYPVSTVQADLAEVGHIAALPQS